MNLLKHRSIIAVIIFSLITCGIYALYYVYSTQESLRMTYRRELLPSGIVVILLGIVTCGIYTIYWMYKTSMVLHYLALDSGMNSNESDTVLFVVLGVFTGTIVFYALIQNKINNIIDYSNGRRY
jgi:hypothetical protein